jgi:hypothetical protein
VPAAARNAVVVCYSIQAVGKSCEAQVEGQWRRSRCERQQQQQQDYNTCGSCRRDRWHSDAWHNAGWVAGMSVTCSRGGGQLGCVAAAAAGSCRQPLSIQAHRIQLRQRMFGQLRFIVALHQHASCTRLTLTAWQAFSTAGRCGKCVVEIRPARGDIVQGGSAPI